jgi:uncharacterized protein with FMN-binding domain
MRRVIIALIGAAFGTTVLVGIKAHGMPGASPVAATTLDPTASASGVEPLVALGPDGRPVVIVNGTPVPTSIAPSASRTAGPTATPKPSTTTPASGTRYTGMAVAVPTAQSPTPKSTPCGDCHNYAIAVTITVSGGEIIAASASYSTSPGSSQSYADRASNSLKQTILSSQDWNLGRVSGATYAGNAWELSAKDAMAKAGMQT